MAPSAHRDDIDWLRAVAVLSVCFFHWHVSPFRGGYVGVDVFFVVSGFLITRIIQSEVRQGTFSFAQFYERRVRRLLPALYVMIALVVLASFFLLMPIERRDLFKSVIATVTFTSNIFFWRQSGYFEASADEKLLLHTWSLSVEEQFYLVLPVIIWFLARLQARRLSQAPLVPLALGALTLASFAAGYRLVETEQVTSAFFLSPPRAWEFLLGSLVSLKGVPTLRNIHLQRMGRIVGLALILTAVFGYRNATPFPGINALLPCLGAAIYLWSGISGPAVLRWRWSPVHVANFFGRISYSLYLWHWPLIIYARFLKPSLSLNAYDVAMVAASAVFLSYLSYRFVEQPVRRQTLIRGTGPAFRFAAVTTAVFILAGVAGIFAPQGVTDKDDALLQSYMNYDYHDLYEVDRCFRPGSNAPIDEDCLRILPNRGNILMWGDSAAAQYVHGLRATLDANNTNIILTWIGTCFATLDSPAHDTSRCAAMSRAIDNWIQHARPDLVIIGGFWSSYVAKQGFDGMTDSLLRTAAALKARGIPLLIIGPSVTYRGRLPMMLLRARSRNIVLTENDIVESSVFVLDRKMKEKFSSRDG
ncbi:MAG TPA: acyltransferase family protein, partial [Afipia sp.]